MLSKLNRLNSGRTLNQKVKVLQFGEGNFLRAFCDWMVDILNEKAGFDGCVQVVQPIRQGMGEMINAQDGLYHVMLNGIQDGQPYKETRLITCIRGVLNPYDNFAEFLKLGENPDLQFIFSNTTEAGIAYLENDVSVDQLPESFPGKITALLYHRFQFFKGAKDKGLILLPCELIDKNGATLLKIVHQYIELWNLGKAFKFWIDDHNTFCNTLVDRIVPGFPKETISQLQEETGYEDHLAVMAEPFHLWVIEAPPSVQERLPLEKAGLQVKFVQDLNPYRTRKVRILNGAHTALVPVAYLRGLRTVRESIEDPFSGNFIRKAIMEEIIPTLYLAKPELDQFANEVIERFQNPFIKHELSSIALNSISKYKVRVLPSVVQYIELKKRLPTRLLYSLAALIRFYKGRWREEKLPVNDTADVLEFFSQAWATERPADVARMVLGKKEFWESDLNQLPGVTEYVTAILQELELEEQKA